MWNSRKSILLSKICTLIFLAAVLIVLITAPWIMDWAVHRSISILPEHKPFFLITIYSGGVLACILLIRLYQLLHNISKEQVFVSKNIFLLRQISWVCYGGGIIAFVSAIYYQPWGFVCVAAAFVGLIIRVIKNIMQQAIMIKEENEFTI